MPKGIRLTLLNAANTSSSIGRFQIPSSSLKLQRDTQMIFKFKNEPPRSINLPTTLPLSLNFLKLGNILPSPSTLSTLKSTFKDRLDMSPNSCSDTFFSAIKYSFPKFLIATSPTSPASLPVDLGTERLSFSSIPKSSSAKLVFLVFLDQAGSSSNPPVRGVGPGCLGFGSEISKLEENWVFGFEGLACGGLLRESRFLILKDCFEFWEVELEFLSGNSVEFLDDVWGRRLSVFIR